MLYRVRLDLSFDNKVDADVLVEVAKKLQNKATGINEGQADEEIGFIDYHLCGHDEGKACQLIERLEVRSL